MSKTPDTDAYSLKTRRAPTMPLPDLPYRPPFPAGPTSKIGLIGAGGIAPSHLAAYRAAGWEVVAICNRSRDKAEKLAADFYPDAKISTDWRHVLDDPSIDIVDITPHPADRLPIMEAALQAGKHVLSQKPFVLDLDEGERLVALADQKGLKLAVNQNGRWAPHLAYMREAVRNGLIGEVNAVHCALHWDHGWIAGTPFEKIEDLILYDFAIHWFDFTVSLIGDRGRSVFATASYAAGQKAKVPLMAQVAIRMESGQVSLVFDGAVTHGPLYSCYIAGSQGSLQSWGPELGNQPVTITNANGTARLNPEGDWFTEGFQGAMGELMSAIEQNREPINGARENLKSLSLCFAAVESRRTGKEVKTGSIRRIVG